MDENNTGGTLPTDGTLTGENMASGTPDFDAFLAAGGQAEFDRRVQAQVDAARQSWKAEAEQAQTEAERMKRMSATERREYELSKREKALEDQRAAFEHERLIVAVGGEMQKRGLPASLAKYITGTTAEESMETLADFETAFRAEVQNTVNSNMRGAATPKDSGTRSPTTKYTRETLRGMTAEEINAHWDEVSAAMKGM